MKFSTETSLTPREEEALRDLFVAGGSVEWLTAHAAAVQAQAAGIEISGPTLRRILGRLRGHVEFRTTNNKRRFHLKKAAVSQLGGGKEQEFFVKPGTPWSTQNELRKFLGMHTVDYLIVVDPYVSEDTLDVLSDVHVPMQVVTAHPGRRGKEADFLRSYKKFSAEKGRNIEIRTVPGSTLHGRYLLTKDAGWVVDHSIQDLGNKPALILPLNVSGVFADVRTHFVGVFNAGIPL